VLFRALRRRVANSAALGSGIQFNQSTRKEKRANFASVAASQQVRKLQGYPRAPKLAPASDRENGGLLAMIGEFGGQLELLVGLHKQLIRLRGVST
jgi:hypothetical protein